MKRRSSTWGNIVLFSALIGLVGGTLWLMQTLQPTVSDVPATPTVRPTVPAVIQTAAPTERVNTTEPPPTPAVISHSNSIENASLFIPAAGINAPVIRVFLQDRGWDVSRLGMNVGHLQGTNWVDMGPGNVVLSGHVEMRSGQRGVFAGLDTLASGDPIILTYRDREYHYNVIEIRNVQPDDMTPLYPTTTARLTLITCDDYDFLRNVYDERTVIVAEGRG